MFLFIPFPPPPSCSVTASPQPSPCPSNPAQLCRVERRSTGGTRDQAWEHQALESKPESKEQSTKLPRRDGLKTIPSGQGSKQRFTRTARCCELLSSEKSKKCFFPLAKEGKKKIIHPTLACPSKAQSQPSPPAPHQAFIAPPPQFLSPGWGAALFPELGFGRWY